MKASKHLIPLHPQCRVFCTTSTDYANIPYPHYHEACELTVIVDGQHIIELEEGTVELTAGDVILLGANILHSRRLVAPGRHVTLAFEKIELERLQEYLELPDTKGEWRCRLNKDETNALIESIEHINLHATVSPERVKPQLRVLLVMLWRRSCSGLHSEKMDKAPWLSSLMQRMKRPENLRGGIAKLLDLCPYSHAYVCREFKRLWGCTPTDYVNSLRLDYAHQLLENTQMGIADICYEIGIESISYFYKLFRNKYGIAPAQYRKLRFISKPNVPFEQLPG